MEEQKESLVSHVRLGVYLPQVVQSIIILGVHMSLNGDVSVD